MLCYRFNISVYCMKKEKRIKNTICKNDENWKDMRCFRLNSIYGYRKFIGNPFLDMILLKKPLCPSLCRHCFSIAKLIHSTQIHFRIWVESIVILVSYSRWQSFALCTKKKLFFRIEIITDTGMLRLRSFLWSMLNSLCTFSEVEVLTIFWTSSKNSEFAKVLHSVKPSKY